MALEKDAQIEEMPFMKLCIRLAFSMNIRVLTVISILKCFGGMLKQVNCVPIEILR